MYNEQNLCFLENTRESAIITPKTAHKSVFLLFGCANRSPELIRQQKNTSEAAELKYDVFWGVGHDKGGKLPSPKVQFLDQIALDATIYVLVASKERPWHFSRPSICKPVELPCRNLATLAFLAPRAVKLAENGRVGVQLPELSPE